MDEENKTILKNIIQRHTNDEGKFNLSTALLEQEAMIVSLSKRLDACEEALTFFSEWYNKTQRIDILVPESLKEGMKGSLGIQDNGLIL